MVAQLVWDQWVGGSNPLSPTKFKNPDSNIRVFSSLFITPAAFHFNLTIFNFKLSLYYQSFYKHYLFPTVYIFYYSNILYVFHHIDFILFKTVN
uniref:Uncharacterized protein n=1 Tax=Yersinia enterocolitica W22703 TaxID=913028 RepID=F4N6S5_YEREN|nr:unknown protein [Yersinia enterocolitica W22703]